MASSSSTSSSRSGGPARLPVAFLVALAVILAVETLLRLSDVRALIPYAWGIEEYDSSAIRLREYDAPHLLVIGSSRARESLDLPTLAPALEAGLGRSLSIGNHALSGARAAEAKAVLQLALRKGKPELVLLGVSPRLLQGRRQFLDRQARFWSCAQIWQARSLPDAPALTTIAARTQLGGLIRTLRYRDRLSGALDAALTVLQRTEGLGSALRTLHLEPLESPQAGGRTLFQQETPYASLATRPVPDTWIAAALERVIEDGEYELTAERADTLRAIFTLCREAEVDLLMFEIPMSRDLVRLLPMGTMEVFRHALRGLAAEQGVSLVELSELGVIFDDADFYEPSHLNRVGAQKLSRALAEQVLLPRLKARGR